MTSTSLQGNLRARFKTWFTSMLKDCSRSRLRRRTGAFNPIAAQVELLESRRLLTVTAHGGAVLPAVTAQAVYLGSAWQTNATLQTQKGQLDQFVSTIVNSQYMDMLTNAGYNVGRGTAKAGVVDNITLSTTITDAQIQADIQAMIKSGQLQSPGPNNLYIVYVEPGVVVNYYGSTSSANFLGYHTAFAGKTAAGAAADIHYAVIPHPGAPNFTSTSQGYTSDFNEMTSVSSHELAESVTDPNVNYKALGWYDSNKNGEIADLAAGHYATLDGYQVEDVVNQSDQVISPTSVVAPTGSLTAPQNLSATAPSSTTVNLSWTAATGTIGYQILQINGTQSVLLQVVSASSTSAQITGLPVGTKETFEVESYNATQVAASQPVSVTTPATASQSMAAPAVKEYVLSATSVVLYWNPVSGAQSYRVYWKTTTGTVPVLLGSVTGVGVTVSSLPKGSTSLFMVEAVGATTVADSPWVTYTVAAASPRGAGFSQFAGWGGSLHDSKNKVSLSDSFSVANNFSHDDYASVIDDDDDDDGDDDGDGVHDHHRDND